VAGLGVFLRCVFGNSPGESRPLRALGVTTVLPNVPTAEAGVPGYEVDGWYDQLGPAATPLAVVT
jgi:hypothetical protein